jgi:hypothetical protein
MPNLPPESECDELEVKFNSCTPFTCTVHKSLLQQLCDQQNRVTPSQNPFLGALNPNDYVDITMSVGGKKINWNYNTQDPDHGFGLIDVIAANSPQVNPLEQLRREVDTVFQNRLKPLHLKENQ